MITDVLQCLDAHGKEQYRIGKIEARNEIYQWMKKVEKRKRITEDQKQLLNELKEILTS